MSRSHADITNSIQRLENFEIRFGIRFEALFASVDGPDSDSDYKVIINGEIHSRSGDEISDNLEIIASIHDDQGRVLKTEDTTVYADSFFSFETFSFSTYVRGVKPSKIRLYPKAS